jgi:Ner family transcriptional regulator
MDVVDIIHNLKVLGFSQTAIAKDIGVTVSVVNNVIHGNVTSHDVANHIAGLLGQSIEDVWPGLYVYKPRASRKSSPKLPSALTLDGIPKESRAFLDKLISNAYALHESRIDLSVSEGKDNNPVRWRFYTFKNNLTVKAAFKNALEVPELWHPDALVRPLINSGLIVHVPSIDLPFWWHTESAFLLWRLSGSKGGG